ncbi:hypothetical protein GCM10027447_28250 [Glycomyces halotolerans]
MAERTHDWTGIGAPSRSSAAEPRSVHDRLEGPLLIAEYDHPQPGIRAGGAVDLNSHGQWARALRQAASRRTEVHLDLSELGFIDVQGVAVLVDVARRLGDGERIVVHQAPPCMTRIMQVLWPEGIAAITIEGIAQ